VRLPRAIRITKDRGAALWPTINCGLNGPTKEDRHLSA